MNKPSEVSSKQGNMLAESSGLYRKTGENGRTTPTGSLTEERKKPKGDKRHR
jgi:hypothetical protein